MVARKRRTKAMPECNHMAETHRVKLTAIQVLSLISASTHAVRTGYDDAPEFLEEAVNELLEQTNTECKFKRDGTMLLTYNAKGTPKKRKVR